ncbi:hypothetical protein A1O3_07707 [Capronia epimyces CBS 606.96]|uniref:Zn(2)-C6 fungal-type domain-containing protein n=1 Tax=Capronia epimyces CBS 606.96 TaxID=1182542 RepID=W9XVQ9_9EURO|nr:uncharacterized protein A1O3_07707 [Capronia epimyces CBS 606.96]EXJ81415.1 hypothetical protein A1O3_07707 [Capronia epimyces CBS 606.96]
MSTSTATGTESGRLKKGFRPPVKVACTSCRASRTRCDGKAPCNNCQYRGKDCRYVKSNRGGPRVARKKAFQATVGAVQAPDMASLPSPDIDWMSLMLSSGELHDDLIASMISPGAGLTDLDQDGDSDQIFDSIFLHAAAAEDEPEPLIKTLEDHGLGLVPYRPLLRRYHSTKSVLNAYYIFVHPFLPILPPPTTTLEVDAPVTTGSTDFQPASPLAMALLAILSLIPHPDDAHPDSDESVCLRRHEAHTFSDMAMESIEIETELLESATSPSAALDHTLPSFSRERFHPCLPVELESVLAHVVLSIYEYAQRGNLAKMRNRTSQAYDAAIRLGLHDISSLPIDECTEARRRAWWMTYTVVLQSSIVSNLPPIISIDFHQFSTPLPTTSSDSEVWAFYIEAQQCILRCTQYTVALRKALDSGLDVSTLDLKQVMLDDAIDAALATYTNRSTQLGGLSPTAPTDVEERTVAQSLHSQATIKLMSARIKLHRYRAFQDVPIFTRRHCDLDQVDQSTPRPLGCSCPTINQSTPVVSVSVSNANLPPTASSFTFSACSSDASTNPSSSSSASFPDTDTDTTGTPIKARQPQPFSNLPAAKTCLRAALAIGRAFEALPYPNPMQLPLPVVSPATLSLASTTSAPRTMPSFACCAMQSCYVLLTMSYRSREMQCMYQYQRSMAADKGLEELYAGVDRVLAALQNYSIAFEALSGMTREF